MEATTDNTPLTLQQVMDYENFACNLFMSFVYATFTDYFIWVCRRKHNRYLQSLKMFKQ